MVGQLLLRGMLIGIAAGLIGFGFARAFGEPSIDMAIAFEEQMSKAEEPATHAELGHGGIDQGAAPAPDDELVSRETQAGLGLLAGVVVYGAALGGLLSLAFAFAYGRLGALGARGTAALVGLLGFLGAIAVPAIKYPANPPAVGQSETIAYRTEFFFTLLGLSLLAMILAIWLQRLLASRLGSWNAGIVAAAAYAVTIAAVMVALPTIDEVPENFSATLLWSFRTASLGLQGVMWAVIALALGWQAEKVLAQASGKSARLKHGSVP